MVTKAMIDDFLAQRTLAIVGVSRKAEKFGNSAFKELKTKGYQLFLVHPSGEVILGEKSYPSLKDLPQKVGGVLVSVPPAQAEKVVQEAHEVGHQPYLAAAGGRVSGSHRLWRAEWDERGIWQVHLDVCPTPGVLP